jgi:hypothetical protein
VPRLVLTSALLGSFLVRIADARYFLDDYEGAVTFALKALGQPNFSGRATPC